MVIFLHPFSMIRSIQSSVFVFTKDKPSENQDPGGFPIEITRGARSVVARGGGICFNQLKPWQIRFDGEKGGPFRSKRTEDNHSMDLT